MNNFKRMMEDFIRQEKQVMKQFNNPDNIKAHKSYIARTVSTMKSDALSQLLPILEDKRRTLIKQYRGHNDELSREIKELERDVKEIKAFTFRDEAIRVSKNGRIKSYLAQEFRDIKAILKKKSFKDALPKFEESKHKRDKDGKFSSTGGGGGSNSSESESGQKKSPKGGKETMQAVKALLKKRLDAGNRIVGIDNEAQEVAKELGIDETEAYVAVKTLVNSGITRPYHKKDQEESDDLVRNFASKFSGKIDIDYEKPGQSLGERNEAEEAKLEEIASKIEEETGISAISARGAALTFLRSEQEKSRREETISRLEKDLDEAESEEDKKRIQGYIDYEQKRYDELMGKFYSKRSNDARFHDAIVDKYRRNGYLLEFYKNGDVYGYYISKNGMHILHQGGYDTLKEAFNSGVREADIRARNNDAKFHDVVEQRYKVKDYTISIYNNSGVYGYGIHKNGAILIRQSGFDSHDQALTEAQRDINYRSYRNMDARVRDERVELKLDGRTIGYVEADTLLDAVRIYERQHPEHKGRIDAYMADRRVSDGYDEEISRLRFKMKHLQMTPGTRYSEWEAIIKEISELKKKYGKGVNDSSFKDSLSSKAKDLIRTATREARFDEARAFSFAKDDLKAEREWAWTTENEVRQFIKQVIAEQGR